MATTRPMLDPAGDNRSSIQTAIDDVHRDGGGVVELANGRFPIAGSLELRSNVTLRGTGMITTVLVASGPPGPVVTASGALAGATLEELTIDGGAGWEDEGAPHASAPSTAGVELAGGAGFCFLRRLRLVDLAGHGVRVAGGSVDHLYLEQLVIERCGGDGVVLAPLGEVDGVFLAGVTVRSFGLAGAPGSAGVRTGGRSFISQLHVQPVAAAATGLVLEPGSDHTVASNLFFGVAGGEARVARPGVRGVAVEAELVRDLDDDARERVFP